MLANNDFKKWVLDLKNDIRRSQIKAIVKVNAEMLRLFGVWELRFVRSKKQHLGVTDGLKN